MVIVWWHLCTKQLNLPWLHVVHIQNSVCSNSVNQKNHEAECMSTFIQYSLHIRWSNVSAQGHKVFIVNLDLKRGTLMWIRSLKSTRWGGCFWETTTEDTEALFSIFRVSCHMWLIVVWSCLVLCSVVEFYELDNLEWIQCESIALLKICGTPVTRAELNWAERMTDAFSLVPVIGTALNSSETTCCTLYKHSVLSI